ncbi:hypothetical protein HDU81_004286 [Chytriomyces hyalinus]|nr:hypothetical protein HDU81_004286 [Chytriomyces hyalinus]
MVTKDNERDNEMDTEVDKGVELGTERQLLVVSHASLGDPLLRAVAHALVTVGNRPSSIAQLATLIDKMQLLDNSCIFTPFAMLSKLNVHLKERAAVKEEPLFKWVAVNKTLNHYYLNSPSIPAIPWIHPTPQIARSSPEKGAPKPASRGASAASTSASHMTPASGITNSVEAAAYANLSKAERKRLLFGEPHSDSSGSNLPRSKKAKTLHKRGSLTAAAAAVGTGFDYDTDTDEESMEYTRMPQDSGMGGRTNSSSSGKKRAGPQESKCNLKALPPYTDLLASDPMPFVPSVLNPDVNSLIVPPNTYYHIQDDRCMNRKRYSEFPKCRSCIWKHRERLPHCFYVGFRAFLVRVPETKPVPANPVVVNAESEDAESGADGADTAKSIKTDADEAGKLVSIDDKQESASTTSVSDCAGTIHSAAQSSKKPFRAKDLDASDPYRVIADLPPGDLIYGPYFIAGGLSNAAHAVNGAGQKKTAVGGGAGGGSHAKKRAKMSELQSSSDEAETAKIYQPSKSNGGGNVLRRHKSMPAFGSSGAGFLSGTDELATPASRKTAHYKSIKLASAASTVSGVSSSMSPLGGASSESPTAPSLALEDHNSDFTDLVVTPNLPFVPSLADPTVNKILIPPKTLFHIQDDKCLNKKRYNDFPKCRSCRWKHKERLPHCFYVGFRAFLLASVPEDAPALPQATEGEQSGPFNREEVLQYRYLGDVAAEDLLYGPYFMPGGVDVEGHVLATVGVKKGVAGRKKRGRPASAALPPNHDSMDGGDGDDARRESFISAADTLDEGDSFAAATEDELAVGDDSPSTAVADTAAVAVSVADLVESSETTADVVAVETVIDAAHVPSVESSQFVENTANENANETSHAEKPAASDSEVAGVVESQDSVKDIDPHSQTDSMDVDMDEPIKATAAEEQKPDETAMIMDADNTAPVVPPHPAVIDENPAMNDVEMSAVDVSVKDATAELKEVETDHTAATADSAVTQPPAMEGKESADAVASEGASREISSGEMASEHTSLPSVSEIQPVKENVHSVDEKVSISHVPIESDHTPVTAPAPVVNANVAHVVISQPENEVHSNIRESSVQPHMHQSSSHLMSSFSNAGEGVRERSCELAALADIVLAVGERMPEYPASGSELVHSGSMNQNMSAETFSGGRNENRSPHSGAVAGAAAAGVNGTPNLLEGLELLSATASQDESGSAASFMDKSRAKEYAAKIRGALLDDDGRSRFIESGKHARHGEQ